MWPSVQQLKMGQSLSCNKTTIPSEPANYKFNGLFDLKQCCKEKWARNSPKKKSDSCLLILTTTNPLLYVESRMTDIGQVQTAN